MAGLLGQRVMGEQLAEFRRLAAGHSFAWGSWDCGLLCAEWVLARRGVDPALMSRGRYSTALGLARFLMRRGGLIAHFDDCLSQVGIKRVTSPRRGDVVIVEAEQGLTAGIVTGPLVMLPCAVGIVERRLDLMPVVAAWRV